MTQFNPPIESRDPDELILISKSTTDEWQQSAIEISELELKKRGLNQSQIDSRYVQLEKEFEEQIETELKAAAIEDYSVFEKILIMLFWPKELFHDWDLRQNGYELKAKRRVQLILAGLVLYVILILTSF